MTDPGGVEAGEGGDGVEVRSGEPLSRHTYLRIGGPAEHYAEPATLEGVSAVLAWAAAHALPVRVLGGGSNILVSDAGVRGLVLSLRRACGDTRFEGATVVVGGAVMLPALARAAAARGLAGLEFAIGIPGSVGGALQTNAGIGDGRSIGPLVRAVEVVEAATGARRRLEAPALTFDYRTSSLRGSGLIVLEATLELRPAPSSAVEAEMRRLLEARQRTQPTAQPNAGSMFRNPPGDAAGRVIEAAGCKGLRHGGAWVSELHANFIVHDGAATAEDVSALMAEVQRRVRLHSSIDLIPEVEWWGDGDLPAAFRPS